MTATTEQWLRKAEKDYFTACREFVAQEATNYDAVCFHAQQCVEKLMKGLLTARQQVSPKTHDLVVLSQQLDDLAIGWSFDRDDLIFLSRAAVEFRYPGDEAEADDATRSIKVCEAARAQLLELLRG